MDCIWHVAVDERHVCHTCCSDNEQLLSTQHSAVHQVFIVVVSMVLFLNELKTHIIKYLSHSLHYANALVDYFINESIHTHTAAICIHARRNCVINYRRDSSVRECTDVSAPTIPICRTVTNHAHSYRQHTRPSFGPATYVILGTQAA